MATHDFPAPPFSTVYEDKMPLLFCNIGWMRDYNGIDGDSIHRGGSYNKHADGHEVCNFSDVNGKVFGYVQSTGKISLEKLGAAKTDKSIDGVTVIWTAGPDDGGTAVVGWYLNATVFREPQEIKNKSPLQKENGLTLYRISAASEDAILLPPEKRLIDIPRGVKGGIGQSNVWFAASPESKQTVATVLRQIASTHNPQKVTDVDDLAHGLEGNPKLVAHVRRERDSSLVKKKKISVFEKTGALACEACGFDFSLAYGKHGTDFCEVHHLRPLSEADGERKTSLSDLAIVCSNCHRIIHRIIPMPTIAEMKSIIQKINPIEKH